MMDYPDIDDDRYPTEETLEEIKNWPYERGRKELMEFVRPIFEAGFGRFECNAKGTKWKVACVGWSGNECAIMAMEDNFIFWSMCWKLSRRGGYYEFELRGS